MRFKEIILQFHPLCGAKVELLASEFDYIRIEKGTIIIQEGKCNHYIYAIESGMVRAFSVRDGKDITFWFGQSGDMIFPMQSQYNRNAEYFNVEALEYCVIRRARISNIKSLYATDIDIANWGRRVIEYYSIFIEKELISRFYKTAAERYANLLKAYPGILNKVSLGIIASYIGISQVSLSRLRTSAK